MAVWHRSRRADIALRVTGLLLCGLAYAAFLRLVAMHVPPQKADFVSYGLAAIGVLTATAGCALIVLGRHLFDEIEVSARWGRQGGAGERLLSEGNIAMDIPEPAMLVIGRDVDGDWTVRESGGMLLGRFVSAQAAQRFAEAERRGRQSIAIATSAGSARRITGQLGLALPRTTDGARRG